MENEKNINYDTEPEEEQALTLNDKLQNTLKSLKPDMDNFDKAKLAKSFVEKCLIPEKLSKSDAESYIKLKLAKEFAFSGREGNKAITDIKNRYNELALANMNSRKTKSEKTLQKVITNSVTSDKIINDIVMDWKDYIYPYDYSIKNGKIVKTVEQMNFKTMETEAIDKDVSCTPFILCKRTEPLPDGTTYYTIRYAKGNSKETQEEFELTMSDLLDSKKMHAALVGRGINIASSMIFETNEYISKFIYQLGNRLVTEKAIIQNGWNDDCTFFAMGNVGININGTMKIVSKIETIKHIKPFHQKGTIEKWCEVVTPLLNYNIARFIFYDGMAAPLYKILNAERQLTNLYGPTSHGKTATAYMVSSTLGNPIGAEGLEFPVGTSVNPLIAHVAGMNDMPVDIEEATGEKKRKVLIDAVYDIANGMEKIRNQINGKNRNDVKSFRVAALITSENPISGEMDNAGGMYRVNEVGGENELIPEGNGEMIDALKKGVANNYGFFFPILIQKIIERKDKLNIIYQEAFNKIDIDLKSVPEECRTVAERSKYTFAVKIVAGYLCEEIFQEIGIPAKTHKQVEEIVSYYYKQCVISDRVESDSMRALRYLYDTLTSERGRFYTCDSKAVIGNRNAVIYNDPKVLSGAIGNLTESKAELLRTEFTKIMKGGRFVPKSVANDLERWKIAKDHETIYMGNTKDKKDGIVINLIAVCEKLGIKDKQEETNIPIDEKVICENIITLLSAIVKIKKSATRAELEMIMGQDLTIPLKKLSQNRAIYQKVDETYTIM